MRPVPGTYKEALARIRRLEDVIEHVISNCDGGDTLWVAEELTDVLHEDEPIDGCEDRE